MTMTTRSPDAAEPLLTPAEVAALFRVDPKTVARWAKIGKLSSIRTLGGHRRFRESEVHELLAATVQMAAPTGIAAPSAPECLNDPLDGDSSALFSVPPAVGQVTP